MIAWLRKVFGYDRPAVAKRTAPDPELAVAQRLHAARSARVGATAQAATDVATSVRSSAQEQLRGSFQRAERRLSGR